MKNQNKIKSTVSPPITSPNFSKNLGAPNNVFFNTCFDKNHLKTVIAWFLEKYGEKATVDLVETLKQVGFHQATRAGVSLGVDDLKVPPQKNTQLSQAAVNLNNVTNSMLRGHLTSVEKSQRLIDTWNQTSENLRQTAVQNFRTTNPVNPVYMMAFSGARGNISQVRQLVAMRGLMADPQGAILEFPIQSNFREGLTVTEYLLSCYGARKGLVDTALRTATSGYLTRRLVDAVQHVVVHVKDCHTKKGLVIKGKNLEKRLIGRVLFKNIEVNSTTVKKNTLISDRLAKQIASQYKEILVRSPLTCQTEKSVCQLCYGLDLAQGKLVSIGESVGIIAAQSIGEPGTQLTMRTFHTGGVGVFSEQAMKSFAAPFAGKVEFLEPLSGLFVRTPHGNIVYLLKHKTVNENKPILKLTCLETLQKPSVYQIMHSDVPAGSLLWVKQGEVVENGQLLVQASRLQTPTQEMPESSHPVRASMSGEVFFEKMAIRVIEEEKRGGSKTKKKTTKQEEKKEISPKFPTLIELGNFWIFSAFIQKEEKFGNSFFLKGDLVSPETPIQQYNLYFLQTGQVKRLNYSIVFGRKYLDFNVSNIQYCGLFYFLKQKEKTQEKFFAYTRNSQETLFTWYPFFSSKKTRNTFGYCSVIDFESDFIKRVTPQKQEIIKYRDVSFVWSPSQLFRLNTNINQLDFERNALLHSSCFLFAQNPKTLSKTGVFLLKSANRVKWTLKNRFSSNFVKNLHKTFLQTDSTRNENPLFGHLNRLTRVKSLTDEKENSIPKIQQRFRKTLFIEQGLASSYKIVFSESCPKLIEKQQVWVSTPETSITNNVSSQLSGILLEPGKKFENFRFNHSYVSTNLIHTRNIVFLKSKLNQNNLCYSVKHLLDTQKLFSQKDIQQNVFENRSQLNNFSRKTQKRFCFYKQQGLFQSKMICFETKRKRRLSHVLFLQQNSYHSLPNKQVLKQKLLFSTRPDSSKSLISVKSPLFTKQSKSGYSNFSLNFKNSGTGLQSHHTIKPIFNIVSPTQSGWFSFCNFLKIEIKIKTPNSVNKVDEFKKTVISGTDLQTLSIPSFNVFFYQKIKLQNTNKFEFQTFPGGRVLPEFKLTEAFLMAKKLGEFRIVQEKQKQKQTSLSIFRAQDQTVVNLPSEQLTTQANALSIGFLNKVQVGAKVRWGQEILEGFAIPVSGQIIKTSLKTMTVRKGLPILASIRGLVHISHQDLVEKNDLLITLRSRRLQTEDIVQGIPKIEQLFEARETQGGEKIKNSMHDLLEQFFKRARQVRPFEEAVDISFLYIQKFLVDNILEAYSNQGVTIAEKHVEVVVRQMTARVRITTGGDTGFLPGEFVQRRWIEQVNLKVAQTGRRVAKYEPVILGITKSVLQSESFLLAASFQQVSKVLVKSALSKKTDFLRGLHENLLVGQPIPAGTGIIEHSKLNKKSLDILENSELLLAKSASRETEALNTRNMESAPPIS